MIKQEAIISVEIKNGLTTKPWTKGSVMIESTGENGNMYKLYKYYSKSGKLRLENNFKNGELHGERKFYDEEGNLELEQNCVNDKLTTPTKKGEQ